MPPKLSPRHPAGSRVSAKETQQAEVDSGRDYGGPRSLARVLALLGKLSAAEEGLTLAELSAALECPKSSLLNLLRPLVAEGYLSNALGTYRLGPAIFRLSASVLGSRKLPRLIRPFMAKLARETGESVLLGVLSKEAGAMTYIDVIESAHPIRYQIPVGTTRPLYTSASGRLLLAFAEEEWRETFLSSVRISVRTRVPVTIPTLRKDLQQIRAAGYAFSIDGYMLGASAVSAPVFDAHGGCAASLTVAGPSERFRDRVEDLRRMTCEAAQEASGLVSCA